MTRVAMLVLAAGFCCGCTSRDKPPMEVSNISIFAPLPGSRTSVAYMTIHNNTVEDVALDAFDSEYFGNVSLHETSVTDGVARMRALPRLAVPAGSSVALREGGLHLMLMEPNTALKLGEKITVMLSGPAGAAILVTAALEPRLAID